tara:strand:+ start:746 stop:1771 length:1026 start_codon:yes stop_codon:yes gene_type:complete
LIKGFLLEARGTSEPTRYEIPFSRFSVTVQKHNNGKVEITSWPKKYNGKPVSEKNPIPLEIYKDKPVGGKTDVYNIVLEEISRLERESRGDFDMKYDADPKAGYPIILCNVMSKPISQGFISMIPEAYKEEIESQIPEGHVFLLIVDPRTRRVRRFDFGVFSQSDGGNPACMDEKGDKMQGIFGFAAVGSFVYKDQGVEADLEKQGNNYIMSEDQIEEIISNTKSRTKGNPEIDYVVINGCNFRNVVKAQAHINANDCAQYNVIPQGFTASLVSTFESMYDFFAGEDAGDSTVPSNSGDNCASMTYKLAYLAKKGSFPNDVSMSILQYPPSTIDYARKNLA